MMNGDTPKKRGKPKGTLNRRMSKSGSVEDEDDF
jgi:hypothetical protein